MKNIFILLLFILFVQSSFAQTAQKSHWQLYHEYALRSLLRQNDSKGPVAKPTSVVNAERVVAQSTRDNTALTLTDSLNLRYTGSRGSKYDYNSMLYPYNYPYSTSPMFNNLGVFTTPQVLFDTCYRWTVNPFTNVYGFYEVNYASYDTHNNLTNFRDVFVDSVTNQNMRYVNTFNSNNNIATGCWLNVNMGVSDSAFKQYFQYDTSHLLVKDSVYELHLGVWRLASKTTYSYEASNNLIQVDEYANATDTSFLLPLIEQQKYVNTYDASNRLLTVLTYLYSGTALAQSVKDTFAYTGALTYYSSWKEQQYDVVNAYWAPIINVQKHITAGLPDTVNTYSFDSFTNAWVPQEKDLVHYDTAHNPDTMRMFLYNWTSFPATPNYTKVYYYNTYKDTVVGLGVDAETLSNIAVYPNPAGNMVTVSSPDIPGGSTVSVSFINMAGQTLYRQATYWQGNTQISTGGLVPGIYWLVIQNREGAILGRRQVIKE